MSTWFNIADSKRNGQVYRDCVGETKGVNKVNGPQRNVFLIYWYYIYIHFAINQVA